MPRMKRPAKPAKKQKKRGPAPEVLQIDGNWKDAIKRSFEKKRPKDGWPQS